MELDDPVLKVETKEPTCRAQHEIGHHYSLREQYRSQQLAAAQMHHVQQLCKQLGFRALAFLGFELPCTLFCCRVEDPRKKKLAAISTESVEASSSLGIGQESARISWVCSRAVDASANACDF